MFNIVKNIFQMIKWTPHCYQRTAISFLLSNPKSGLFLDPGLGKTSTSLSAIKILKNSDNINGVLMIAPLRVIYSVWPAEIDKWSNFKGLTCTILHGDNKSSLWSEHKDIYLINPEGLPWLFDELLTNLKKGKKCPFDTLWIDESTKFKSQDSKGFNLLKDMSPLFKRKHIMTGTPAPKSLNDLWSQIFLLDEGNSLGPNYYKFRNKYFQADDWNKYSWKIKDFAAEQIHNAIAPLVLEMSAKDHLDMPELLFNNIAVKLPKKALKQYKQMENDFFAELDEDEINVGATAQASMKCHQMANGNVYENIPEDLDEAELRAFKKTRKTLHVHTAKIEALQELINELNGKPLLIAYHFKHDLQAIRKLLGEDIIFIGSGVTPEQSKSIEKDWNAGNIPFLAAHPASMAHGLNFQKGGNDICWFSLTWNLEEYMQLNARIYRQGVTGSVRVHHLVGDSTLDEAMLLRLGERAKGQHDLREALKQYRLGL